MATRTTIIKYKRFLNTDLLLDVGLEGVEEGLPVNISTMQAFTVGISPVTSGHLIAHQKVGSKPVASPPFLTLVQTPKPAADNHVNGCQVAAGLDRY
jgi:hypothetical protein